MRRVGLAGPLVVLATALAVAVPGDPRVAGASRAAVSPGAATVVSASGAAVSPGAATAVSASSYVPVATWPVPSEPVAVAAGSGDTLLVALVPGEPDPEFHTLIRLDADGAQTWSTAVKDVFGKSLRPLAVWPAPRGGAYALGADRLVRLDSTGGPSWSAQAGEPDPDFGPSARGLTAADGLLFSADLAAAHLVGYDPADGTKRRRLGTPGVAPGSYLAPRDVAASADGGLWVADFGNRRLVKTSPVGVVQALVDLPERPRSVAATDAGVVFALLDDETVRVLEDAGNGFEEVGRFGGFGRGAGELQEASDLAVLPAGRVAVADRGNRRIVIFAPSTVARVEALGGSIGGRSPSQSVTITACPGRPGQVTLDVDVVRPAPRADVVLLLDTTGSMDSVISTMGRRSDELHAALAAEVPDLAIGVMEVRDFPYGRAGLSTDWPWAVRSALDPDPAALSVAVSELRADGGGDSPEAYSGALRYAAASSLVGWRAEARRFVVLFADSVPRDDDLDAGVPSPPVPAPWAPGTPANWLDSGLDWAPFTADDADWGSTLEDLSAGGITLFAAVSGADPVELAGSPDALEQYWQAWTARTGGAATQLKDLDALPGTIAGLVGGTGAMIGRLAVSVRPTDRASWVVVEPPEYVDIAVPEGGTRRSFAALLEAPDGTSAGSYPLDLIALGDGVRYAELNVDLDWRPQCDPAVPSPTRTEGPPTETAGSTQTPGATVTVPTLTPPATETATAAVTETAAPGTTPPSPTRSPSPTATSATRVPTETPPVVYLPAVQRDYCSGRRLPGIDVALVLDASSSMTGPKLKAAKAAAGSFLDALRLGRDRAAVVAFDQEAHVLAGLTADRGVARSAVDRVTAAEGTRIDRGLRAATDLLRTGRRPDGRPVIVLLTDGRPELGTEAEAINAAAAARADGVHVVAIGLGADVDAASLARMTAAPGDVHLAPTPADLDAIYLNLAANLPCG